MESPKISESFSHAAEGLKKSLESVNSCNDPRYIDFLTVYNHTQAIDSYYRYLHAYENNPDNPIMASNLRIAEHVKAIRDIQFHDRMDTGREKQIRELTRIYLSVPNNERPLLVIEASQIKIRFAEILEQQPPNTGQAY